MSTRYPPPKEEEKPQVGDTAKRIVVFAFGVLLTVIAIAAATKKEFGFAALFGVPALIFLCVAGWGSRRSVGAAKAVTDVTNLIP